MVVGRQKCALEVEDFLPSGCRIELARLRPEEVIDRWVLPAAVVSTAKARIALAEDLVGQRAADSDRVNDDLEFTSILRGEEGTCISDIHLTVEADLVQLLGHVDRGIPERRQISTR